MTGKMSRTKGGVGEREIVAILKARGIDAYRTSYGPYTKQEGWGDVGGLPGVHLEIKRCEKIELPAWIRQAEADCPEGSVPVVVYRKSRQPWRVNMRVGDLFEVSINRNPAAQDARFEMLFSDFLDLLGYPLDERLAA